MSGFATDVDTQVADAMSTDTAGERNGHRRGASVELGSPIRQDPSPSEFMCDPTTDHPFTD